MKIAALTLGLLLLTATGVDAGLYQIRVMWIDTNIYEDLTTGTRIHTSLCLEMPVGDRAVLNWEGVGGRNWIYFERRKRGCDVVALQ